MDLQTFNMMLNHLVHLDSRIQKYLKRYCPDWVDDYLSLSIYKYEKKIRRTPSDNEISFNKNITWEIVSEYPNFDWDYHQLTSNKNITPQIIQEKIHLKWDWSSSKFDHIPPQILFERCAQCTPNKIIKRLGNVPWEYIIKNQKYSWDYAYLLKTKKISIDIIIDHPEISWDFKSLSQNSCITPEMILAHPNLPWSFQELSRNPSMTLEFIEQTIDKDWNFRDLSVYNPNITFNFVDRYSDKKWWFQPLRYNSNFTYEMIIKDKRFEFSQNTSKFNSFQMNTLSKKATLKDFLRNLHYDWDYSELSFNQNIPIEICLSMINQPWDFYLLSRRPEITLKHIKTNPTLSWDFKFLTRNLKINLKSIFDNPQFPWDYASLPLNKHVKLTWEDVIEHPEINWDYGRIIFQQDIFYNYIKEKSVR